LRAAMGEKNIGFHAQQSGGKSHALAMIAC
jgi:hypothetical protein